MTAVTLALDDEDDAEAVVDELVELELTLEVELALVVLELVELVVEVSVSVVVPEEEVPQ